MQGMTLEEAIRKGRGTERPFRCPQHDDTTASATVNVLKNVWFCHACHAKGKVTGKTAPALADLLAMMEPEKAVRAVPEGYLDLFNWVGEKYWDSFLEPWVTWQLQMGEDPLSGDATFPVHTPSGQLAGVGRRHTDPDTKQKRYLYPQQWSASTSLFGLSGRWRTFPVVCLVEGAKDAASVWETGCPGFGVYGSGLHLPQVSLVARLQPKVVLFGFDMDEAGEEAVTRAFSQCSRMAELKRVRWPDNDPAESSWDGRRRALEKAVRATQYGGEAIKAWDEHVDTTTQRYERYLEAM